VLYDLYHSVAEGEDPAAVLDASADVIDYVQLADVPGRGEPGSGGIDWAASLALLRSAGYAGPIGLEFYPTTDTVDAVARIRDLAASA
jgi:hydroxypyruvate isomerase